MLSTIIGTFIGGWLVCSIISLAMAVAILHEYKKISHEFMTHRETIVFYAVVFAGGPISFGLTFGDIAVSIVPVFKKPPH